MENNKDLFEAVRAARKKQKELYGKVKVRELAKMVGCKGAVITVVNRKVEELEKAEEEDALDKRFHKSLREELSKFGEIYAGEKCQALRQSIESYQETEELLQEQISDLELKQAESKQAIENLQKVKSDLETVMVEKKGEITALTTARDDARKERENAEAKYAGLKGTLAQRSREIREERQRAGELRKCLTDATDRNDRLQGELDRLEKALKASNDELVAEQKAHTKVQRELEDAQTQIRDMAEENTKRMKRKTPARASATTTNNQ